MIYSISELVNAYINMFSSQPIWFIIVYIVLNVIFLVMCCGFEKNGLPRYNKQKYSSSINCVLWFLVILICPIFGFLLYAAGAIMPFVAWGRGASVTDGYFLNFPLRGKQLMFLVGSGIIGKIADYILSQLSSPVVIEHLDFIAAFFAFVLIVICDTIISFSNKRVYILLNTIDGSRKVTNRTLMGRSYKSVCASSPSNANYYVFMESEGNAARIIADRCFGQYKKWPWNSEVYFSDTMVYSHGHKYSYSLLQYNKTNMPDVVETKWLMMQGVTRFIILDEVNGDFTERIIYTAVPRISFLFIRAAILFGVLIALFTPAFVEMHLNIVGFWTNIF